MPVNLRFAGSDYESPLGRSNLRLGASEGGGVEQTPDSLIFWEEHEALVGRVNIRFGKESGAGGALLARPTTISASILPPIAEVAVDFGIAVNANATISPPETVFVVDRDINVDRNPKGLFSDIWENPGYQESDIASEWGRPIRERSVVADRWENAEARTLAVETFLSIPDKIRTAPRSGWEQGDALHDSTTADYDYAPPLSASPGSRYEEAADLREIRGSGYEYATPIKNYHRERWEDELPYLYAHLFERFEQGGTLSIVEGSRFENAILPPPGMTPHPVQPPEPELPPAYTPDTNLVFCGKATEGVNPVFLNFGIDPCAVPVIDGAPFIPTRSFYIVANYAQIIRVADGRNVPASAVRLSINAESHSWQMSATLAGRDALDLFEGNELDPFDPLEVDVNINGESWRVLVDGWNRSASFAQSSVTITGRSRVALMSAPYALPREYVETNIRLAQQLAEQELPIGWALNWELDDWLVPAGAWKYSGLTPIDAISRIAKAGGGYVQADPRLDIVHVKKMYPSAPWAWNGITPDLLIPNSVVTQMSSVKVPGQGVDGVYVHGGDEGGILAKIVRTGFAGNNLSQTIVDPLITEATPARNRGIARIAGSLKHATESYELPLDPVLSGLLTPGEIVAIGNEGDSGFNEDLRAIIRGVTVTAGATRNQNGGVGLSVRQRLEVERHFFEGV